MCYGVAASQVMTCREAVTMYRVLENIDTCFEVFEGCGFSQLWKTYWKYEEKVVFKQDFETLICRFNASDNDLKRACKNAQATYHKASCQ